MQEQTAKTLLATLRRLAPAKVRAFTSDDESKDVAVPTRRRKWAQVLDTLDKLAWTRLELLDRSSALLGTIENSEPATELQDIGGDGHDAKMAPQFALARSIVDQVLRGQKEVLSYRDKEMSTLLSAQGEVMREMVSGMQALTTLYREQVKVASDNAEVRAATAAAAEGGSDIKQLIEAAPLIMQVLPMLRKLLTSGDAAPSIPPTKKG